MRRGLDRMRSRREGFSHAALYTLSRMLHYLLLILGTVVALSSIGIDFTKFALFATALGLLAAIPAVIFYNKYSADSQAISHRLEAFADEFAAIVSRQIDVRS